MSRTIDPADSFANPRNYELAKKGLLKLREVLDGLGVEWYLAHGTLLGCVREHDLIPHDFDLDVPVNEHTDLTKVEYALVSAAFFPQILPPEKYLYRGDRFGMTLSLPGARLGEPWDVSVDIWKQYTLNENEVFEPYEKGPWVWVYDEHNVRTGGHATYDKIIFPRPTKIVRVPFLGSDFPIPENYDAILTAEYGNWHEIDPNWTTGDAKTFGLWTPE